MKNLNYLTNRTLYQMFKIVLSKLLKKLEILTDNPPIKIYVNEIGNRITFKIIKKIILNL